MILRPLLSGDLSSERPTRRGHRRRRRRRRHLRPVSFTVDRIRDENEYGGVRIKGNATVDNARVRVVIDIAFGDAIEPGVQETDLPVLLDFPAPKLRSYPRETVIAEKFQAMVALGLANTRLKDFYDVWV